VFGLIPFKFRFRGKLRTLLQIYQCFKEHPATGLHPTQICRHTGIGFATVNRRLDDTPELFVKLPKRDGITRYRLTSVTTARAPEEVEALLNRLARRESLLLYAYGLMLLCTLAIVALLVRPAL
jgi:hypothetical protein